MKRIFRPTSIVVATVILTILLFVPVILMQRRQYHRFNHIIDHQLPINNLSGKIIYLDEVLTMSANMYVYTGDVTWKNRYELFRTELDLALKNFRRLARNHFLLQRIKTIDTANNKLTQMNEQSFILTQQGKKTEAQALLSSIEYERNKIQLQAAIETSKFYMSTDLQEDIQYYRKKLFGSIFLSGTVLILLIPLWLIVLRSLYIDLKARKVAEQALAKANIELELRVERRTQELNDNNIKLKETFKELKQTQSHLIHSEKMSSLGQMVAGIAHEINNPLNFILGNLSYTKSFIQDLFNLIDIYQQHYFTPPEAIKAAIEDMDLDFAREDFSQIFSSMKTGVNRIEDIVKSLRTFSRLDEAELKKVDIHESIESTLLMLNYRFLKNQNQCEICLIKDYAKLPFVECYSSELNQALLNILTNGIDALQKRRLQCKNECDEDNSSNILIRTEIISKSWIGIHIIDNGIGIDESIQDKIFDPFFTTKPIGQGTGLGLSTTYQIVVKRHAGKLYFNSTLEEGTEFVIEIPVYQISAMNQDESTSSEMGG